LIDELKSIQLPLETTWQQISSIKSETSPWQLTQMWYEASQMEQLSAFEEYIKELERDRQTCKRNQLARQGRLAREEFNKTLTHLF
jgi:hypothetical protein